MSKETRETLEQGHLGPEASEGNQASGVKMAALARRDPVGSWGPPAIGASVGRSGMRALPGLRVTRVTQQWPSGLRVHEEPRGTWVNEGLVVWMVTKDLGATMGTLVTRVARESLEPRVQPGCWELVD